MTVRGAIGSAMAVGVMAGAQAAATGPVKVTGGAIAGVQEAGVKRYLGIPFAAPPVGELRWRAPQPVPPWQGVRDASALPPACAQTAAWINLPTSEDCLYLNVWAPAGARGLPVIVWIHGGGYYGGSGAQPGFDGTNLSKHGAVVVTINYRLGVLGFFAHPDLAREDGPANQGLLDQLAALRWVRDNIAAFGGNPRKVAIAGESAGGYSVNALVASPMAKGLFQRAISESGGDALPFGPDERGDFEPSIAAEKALTFSKAAGARSLADLRALSVEALHKQPWVPQIVADGTFLRDDLTTLYRTRRVNDVPLLVGWNAEEGRDLAPEILGTPDFTAARHRELVGKLVGREPSDAMLTAYPGTTDAEAKASIERLTTDWWGWHAVRWAGLHGRQAASKAYVYYFTHRPAEPATPCGYGCGAGHGAEIRYVFDNLDQDNRQWSAADRALAHRLAETWVRFARTGKPEGKGLPAWPAYDGTAGAVLRIGSDPARGGPLPDWAVFER